MNRVSGRAWGSGRIVVLASAVLAVLAAGPGASAAQQNSTGARPAPADSVPGQTPADTVPADTLSPRERALRRLRALPDSPIQPDTLGADTLDADTVGAAGPSADSLAADVVAAVPEPADTAAAGAPVLPDRPIPIRPEPGDTMVLFDGDGWLDAPQDVLLEDSVLAQLRRLEGYQITEYQGEAAVFEAGSNQLELTGASQIGREGSSLATDSLLVYDGEAGVVCGYGAPVLSGEAEPVESDELCFDIDRELGQARGARTTFSQGGHVVCPGGEQRGVRPDRGRAEHRVRVGRGVHVVRPGTPALHVPGPIGEDAR
ncbi:MAG: hypothetical protein P8177_01265 [Gemmatimonadota bacterium]